jgi:type I restriction enzyme S subunit
MQPKWQTKKIVDICSFDKTPNIKNDLPYIGLEDIEPATGRFIGSTDAKKVKSLTFNFTSDHVLYGRLRPYLNKVLLPNFEGHCSTEIFPITLSNKIDKRFFFYWLTSKETVKKINDTCTGTRMPRANMNAFLEFEISYPPITEQQHIVTLLDKAFAALTKIKRSTDKNIKNSSEIFENELTNTFSNPPDNWEICNIDEHIKFIDYRGKTPKKTPYGLRLITAKNVKNGFIQQYPEEFINPDDYDTWMTRGIPKMGDVLFTTEAPLANIAQLDTNEKVAFAQRIIIMQPHPDKINTDFLKYLLLSSPIKQKIIEKGTGATVQGIKASLLKKISIYFPKSIDEQIKIVNKLDALTNNCKQLESSYRKKIVNLEELTNSIFQKAFSGELTTKKIEINTQVQA